MKKLPILVFLFPLFTTCWAGSESTGPAYDSFLNLMPIGKLVDTMSLDQLANMVVTESKVAQAQESVTQKIVVLHASDFEQQTLPNRNLSELMGYTAGQFVNVLSRNDANWGSYAGLGPKYNSYLLDGLPIDSFVDAMSLDPWAFDRIEAYQGPASILYANYLNMDFAGNETPLTGTTNFILKDKIDFPMTRAFVGYGSYNTWNERLYHQDRTENLSYLFGGNYERSDYTQYGASGSWLQTSQNPNYDKYKLYGKLFYAFGRDDHTLSLFAHYTSHQGDLGRPNRDFDHSYDIFNLTYNNQLTKQIHLQFNAGQRDYDRQFGNDNYPTSLASTSHDKTTQRIRPIDLTLSYAHAGNALLTAGVDAQTVHYQTSSEAPGSVVVLNNKVTGRSSSLFLQEKMQIGAWVLRAGVRHSSIDQNYDLLNGVVPTTTHSSWDKNLWGFGVRYNLSPRLSFYGNSGSSFMAPAARQVGGSIPLGSNLDGQLPNPGLHPENGIGNDLGVDWQPFTHLTIGLRTFLNRIQNAIIDNVVSVTPSQTQSVNAGSATAKGFGLDIQHAWSNQLHWFGNLTYTRTRVHDTNNTDIPFAPNLVANLCLTAQLPRGIILSPYYHWVGRYYDSTSQNGRQSFGRYGLLNTRLQTNLVRNANYALNLTVDLNNLFDKHFDLPWGFQDTGFNAFAGFNLVF